MGQKGEFVVEPIVPNIIKAITLLRKISVPPDKFKILLIEKKTMFYIRWWIIFHSYRSYKISNFGC